MTLSKPVSVPKAAFAFCRWGVAALIWAALAWRLKPLLVLVFALLALSAILKVGRAPMIMLYTWTFHRLIKSRDEVLDENAMRFAHTIGSVFALACVILLYFVNERLGWMATALFAIIKTISAFGFCPASKLFQCMSEGGCCALTRKNGC